MVDLKERFYTFSQAAKAAGITEKQLRNWLDRQLLELDAEEIRELAKWRRFSALDVLHLAAVARLSRYGVAIPEADQVYRSIIAGRLKMLKQFKRTPPEAYMAALNDVELGVSLSSGAEKARFWHQSSGQIPTFSADETFTDYAVVSMEALALVVIRRLIAISAATSGGN